MFGLFRDDLRWTGENWKYIGEPTEGSFNILCWKLKFLWFLNTDIKNTKKITKTTKQYYNVIILNFMFPQSDFFTKAYPKTGFNGTHSFFSLFLLCAMSYWWKSFTFGRECMHQTPTIFHGASLHKYYIFRSTLVWKN